MTLKMPEPVAWRDPVNFDAGQSVTFESSDAARWPHIYRQRLYTADQLHAAYEQGKKDRLRIALIAFAMLCDNYTDELPEDAMTLAEAAQPLMDAEFKDLPDGSIPVREVMDALWAAIRSLSRSADSGESSNG